jgi:hypothetical protein
MDTLCMLRMYNRAHTLYALCTTNVVYIWRTLVNAYKETTHVFFDGISTPYNRADVTIGTPSSAVPLWYYRKDTRTFIEWTAKDAQTIVGSGASLPILSMTIVKEGKEIHDLTDFMGSVQVYHSNRDTFPSIAHLLGAWSLYSRTVLKAADHYSACSITTTADFIVLPTDSHEYFRPTPEDTQST